MDTWSLSMWVSPFRYLRVNGYLLLTAAFRSLSRLSSALSAKASTLRPYQLDHNAKVNFYVTSLQTNLRFYSLCCILNDSDSHMSDIALSAYLLVCFL